MPDWIGERALDYLDEWLLAVFDAWAGAHGASM